MRNSIGMRIASKPSECGSFADAHARRNLSGEADPRIVLMMYKENVDAFASQRPFQPFEIRLVDGQRFRVKSVEQFIVGKYHVAVMNPKGIIVTLGLGLISTIRPLVARRATPARRRRRA